MDGWIDGFILELRILTTTTTTTTTTPTTLLQSTYKHMSYQEL